MESNTRYVLAAIGVMGVTTLALRAVPFVVAGRLKLQENRHVLRLGRRLPPAVMTVLVLFSLKGIDLASPPYGLAEVASLTICVALHAWRRNALASICGGTALYVLLANFS